MQTLGFRELAVCAINAIDGSLFNGNPKIGGLSLSFLTPRLRLTTMRCVEFASAKMPIKFLRRQFERRLFVDFSVVLLVCGNLGSCAKALRSSLHFSEYVNNNCNPST